jgi:hypothetical protein
VIGWAPATFWAATPIEFQAAFDGWAERNGVDTSGGFSRADLDDLMKQYPD